jgi:hypothetical protein
VYLLLRPGTLFERLAQNNRYPSALLLLVFLQALVGSAVLSTGVVDYESDRQAQQRFACVAHRLQEVPAPGTANSALEAVVQEAVFRKQMHRLGWLLAEPIRLLAGLALLGGLLFVAVALQGSKPDLALLAGVAVFASFVELVRMLAVLFLVWQKQTAWVDTSAAVCFPGPDVGLPAYLLLRRLDPFALWYWALLGLGLLKTGQLGGLAAGRTALVLAGLAALAHAAGDLLTLTDRSRTVLGL